LSEFLRRGLAAGCFADRMVMGLCFSAGIRLFAVGDADQSIYGFTGPHPELLQQLSEREDVETGWSL
jgi:superfamily I DNA/RNA helicase